MLKQLVAFTVAYLLIIILITPAINYEIKWAKYRENVKQFDQIGNTLMNTN